MRKFSVVASGIVIAALLQFPSVGISLGTSGSDIFHISMVLRNSLSSFCDCGVFTQYAKNLLIVIGVPLLLVISTPISLGFGLVRAPSVTVPHIGSEGAKGVAVGVKVAEAVKVAVGVCVIVGVFEGVNVREGVAVGVRVLVLVGVTVRVRVCVGRTVRVAVGGPGEGVQEGITKLVNVGKSVGDGLTVGV